MSIKQNGGVFGRNPTFNNVTIEGQLTFDGDIDINSDLKVDGNIETTGNVIIATSGKGIDFSATSGTGTSELLDDYEEGTWTPVFTNATGPTTPYTMVNVVTPRYTKIGRMVCVECWIQTTNVDITGAAGALRISGLPFTASSSSLPAASVTYIATWAGDYPSSGMVEGGTTLITLRTRSASNGADANMDAADLTTGAISANVISLTATYTI